VVVERYSGGSGPKTLETSFSVAKSFVSTLVGIAIDEGRIGSVDDPVTRYVPELAARDPRFKQVTLRELLTMSSGLRYQESSFPSPRGDDTTTYYGVDLRKEALEQPGSNRRRAGNGTTTTTTLCSLAWRWSVPPECRSPTTWRAGCGLLRQ
jgi:CubicO group peptidase (beta-lactamase class C family)